jgi:hypothetical protein
MRWILNIWLNLGKIFVSSKGVGQYPLVLWVVSWESPGSGLLNVGHRGTYIFRMDTVKNSIRNLEKRLFFRFWGCYIRFQLK